MEIIVRDYMDSDLDKVNEILLEAFGVSKGNFKDDNLRELVSVSDSEVSGYLILTKVLNPIKNITDIIKPKNVLPASPWYIFAGGKLWTKYPRVLPSIIKLNIISSPPNLFSTNPIIAIVKK